MKLQTQKLSQHIQPYISLLVRFMYYELAFHPVTYVISSSSIREFCQTNQFQDSIKKKSNNAEYFESPCDLRKTRRLL